MEVLRKLALMGAMTEPVRAPLSILSGKLSMSPQTISRRLRELERIGWIKRARSPRGQWIMITKDGIEALRREYNEYSKIFAKRRREVAIEGEVVTGIGEGKYYTSQEKYRSQFKEKLGFEPFPGTLNLKISEESLLASSLLAVEDGIMIDGFEAGERTFGRVKCFMAKIGNVRAAVVFPERSHHPSNVIEMISPVDLRRKLKLRDGDVVKVKVIL